MTDELDVALNDLYPVPADDPDALGRVRARVLAPARNRRRRWWPHLSLTAAAVALAVPIIVVVVRERERLTKDRDGIPSGTVVGSSTVVYDIVEQPWQRPKR